MPTALQVANTAPPTKANAFTTLFCRCEASNEDFYSNRRRQLQSVSGSAESGYVPLDVDIAPRQELDSSGFFIQQGLTIIPREFQVCALLGNRSGSQQSVLNSSNSRSRFSDDPNRRQLTATTPRVNILTTVFPCREVY